jgi:hypothetical protein
MTENDRIVKLAVGDKVRLTAKVNDGFAGARWILLQIRQLHLDPRSVEFGHELGTYGNPLPEVWLEGYVSAVTGPDVAETIKGMPDVMPCAAD